jgi:septal ring-binding cell division protein DamX
VEPKAEPRPVPKPVPASLAERLETLHKGDLEKAVAQGAQHIKDTPSEHWVLRLEIACQGDTIRRVGELFKGEKPDLFLLPITLRDGRACYQVMYGNFPSKDAAEKESKRLPPAFMAERNRPKPFRFAEIPKEQ